MRAAAIPLTATPTAADAVASVRAAVEDALRASDGTPLVAAVSGGRDSVVLLDALVAVARTRLAGVATFDHGSGEAARAAVAHVRALAAAAGVAAFAGVAGPAVAGREADWRRARWTFLRQVAREAGAAGRPALVLTGHTADDQVETVVLRVLRGAGARGLAAMAAPIPGVVRPLLGVSRETVAAYATACGLRWVADPSNASPAHARNRLRGEALPAIARVRPEFAARVLALGAAAAAWRRAVDAAAASLAHAGLSAPGEAVVVPLDRITRYDAAALAMLWPALAARAGVVLDRRGTARAAAFTAACLGRHARGDALAGAVPLAGGAVLSVERVAGSSPEWAIVLGRQARQALGQAPAEAPAQALDAAELTADALATGVTFGRWRFRDGAARGVGGAAGADPWRAHLAGGARYVVRAWRPGDRMPYRRDGAARRVKRYFADGRVPAAERAGWPVVVAEPAGVVVWIPGVRRSPAAPARPGEPGLDLICERLSNRPDESSRG